MFYRYINWRFLTLCTLGDEQLLVYNLKFMNAGQIDWCSYGIKCVYACTLTCFRNITWSGSRVSNTNLHFNGAQSTWHVNPWVHAFVCEYMSMHLFYQFLSIIGIPNSSTVLLIFLFVQVTQSLKEITRMKYWNQNRKNNCLTYHGIWWKQNW